MAWVLHRGAVESAVAELWDRRIHEHFPGYLCLVWTAARAGRTHELRPDFWRFHEYFMRVPDRENFPYLRPFNSAKKRTAAGEGGIWYQSNVAGSYSPSSVRRQGPLARVVEVSDNGLYSLREGHATLALEHLAYGERVQAVPLAIYMYREFAFAEPSLAGLTSIFRYEFGYENAVGVRTGADFDILYADVSMRGVSTDLFEEFDE